MRNRTPNISDLLKAVYRTKTLLDDMTGAWPGGMSIDARELSGLVDAALAPSKRSPADTLTALAKILGLSVSVTKYWPVDVVNDEHGTRVRSAEFTNPEDAQRHADWFGTVGTLRSEVVGCFDRLTIELGEAADALQETA